MKFIKAIIDKFIGLKDTPNSYSGQGGKILKVKGDESGLEFGEYTAGSGLKLTGTIFSQDFNVSGSGTHITDVEQESDGIKVTKGQIDYNTLVNLPDLTALVDVEMVANYGVLPGTGVDGIIYIVEDTNLTYRWTGSTYVEISPSIALGETSSTAYRGDRGKIAYDHSQLTSGNPHNVTKSDVGLSNVDNTSDANKPISTATLSALNGKVSSVNGSVTGGITVDNTDPRNPIIKSNSRLPIPDTRNANEDPQWYLYNSLGFTTYEFKTINTMGLSSIFTSGTYCAVETITQWAGYTSGGGYPFQIATNPADGKMAKRYGLDFTTWSNWEEFGSMDITPITYTALKTLKTSDSLEPGTRYFITDRDIWIDALDTDKLAMECKRHFRIVKDEFYTPHTKSTPVGDENYLGIYGQTYDRGSVPNSISSSYFAIWGGRMWRRNNSGSDVPGISHQTIAGGWTMRPLTNITYYESKIFNIKYDFDADTIWEQSDDRGNIIKRLSSSISYIDITDWGNVDIYNNENFGIYNNFRGSNKAIIYNNSNNGAISSNSNNGGIYDNSNYGTIGYNSNSGDIRFNANKGSISNNSNTGNIRFNANKGSISNNSNTGNIYENSNSGVITYNSNGGVIYNNSNNGIIRDNSNNGAIYNNSNNGAISSNSNTGGITHIRFNTNAGYISRNIMNGSYLLENNTNNGNIGTSSSNTTRNANITDSMVNK